MPRSDENENPRRKTRTREHVVADLSENFLERKILLRGHLLRRPERDYGVDVTMFHFSDDGAIENGEVRFQLKATDRLTVIKQGTVISIPIDSRDLHFWSLEIYPFILVVFDATADRAYWVHIQQYVDLHSEVLDPARESVNIHIPVSNKLTVKSVDTFRRMSQRVIDRLRNQGGSADVPRKPK